MSLKAKSEEISKNFKAYKEEMVDRKGKLVADIDATTIDLKDAVSKGDLSENAAYTAAVERLSMLNVQLADVDNRVRFMESNVAEEGYHPIGMVVDYSTVRFSHDGEEFIYKFYPGDISSIEKGIMAMESPLGKAIYLKQVGDTIVLEHRVTSEPIEFRIEEIY